MAQRKNMQGMQKRLYFQKIILFIIQALIKNFIINLIYLIKYALQQNRKLVSLFYRNETSFKQGGQIWQISTNSYTVKK